MRILMTGAAGMIGRKLTARLLKDGTLRGQKITALDICTTSCPLQSPRRPASR
jgi:nucleoside-diphosphate-sugar epimerase